MDWRELTSHQKLCQVQLTPETQLSFITKLIASLPNPFGNKVAKPWKRNSVVFSWHITPELVLKIHAQMYLHME